MGATVLGTPRAANPLAPSKKRGGGSIPLAPSSKFSLMLKFAVIGNLYFVIREVNEKINSVTVNCAYLLRFEN